MNVRIEFKKLSNKKQQVLIETFKKVYGYRTYIDPLTGDWFCDFENWLWGNIKEV